MQLLIGPVCACRASDFEPGPHGMFRWVDTWVPCYVFHPSFLTMWGAKCVPSFRCLSQLYM